MRHLAKEQEDIPFSSQNPLERSTERPEDGSLSNPSLSGLKSLKSEENQD